MSLKILTQNYNFFMVISINHQPTFILKNVYAWAKVIVVFKQLSCGVADEIKPQIILLSQEYPCRITLTCLFKIDFLQKKNKAFVILLKNGFIYSVSFFVEIFFLLWLQRENVLFFSYFYVLFYSLINDPFWD